MVQWVCETDLWHAPRISRAWLMTLRCRSRHVAVVPSENDRLNDDERPAAQVCLLQQPFIKDGSKTLADLVRETAAQTGENVRIVQFTRLALGE